ncbi:MAG: hypothetical protein ABSH32_34390 [Bryobacteraceae bacterium]|jgi:hypothetical protein
MSDVTKISTRVRRLGGRSRKKATPTAYQAMSTRFNTSTIIGSMLALKVLLKTRPAPLST